MNKDTILNIRSAGPIYEKIQHLLEDTLFQYQTISEDEKLFAEGAIYSLVLGDVNALATRDPAARVSNNNNLNEKYVTETYSSLYAVVCYRVAHFLQCDYKPQFQQEGMDDYEMRYSLMKDARRISEKCKNENGGIEIHPAAKIGERFILDHGFGTVIGETSVIGDDCCFLQAVILGAPDINEGNNNLHKKEKRHPTIGNRVTIGGHARILGDITIGDDSFIAPYSLVTESIPPFSIVRISNQLQIFRYNEKKIMERKKNKSIESNQELVDLPENTLDNPIRIYGVVPGKRGVDIIGRHLNKCTSIKLIKDTSENSNDLFYNPLIEKSIISYTIQNDLIHLEITTHVDISEYSIYLCAKEYSCIIMDALAWKDYIKTLKK